MCRRALLALVVALLVVGAGNRSSVSYAASGIGVVAQVGDTTPVEGTYSSFGFVAVNDLGHVAFQATVSGGSTPSGIFLFTGTQTSLVVGEGSIAPSGSAFTSVGTWGESPLNNTDQVAFLARENDKWGVYVAAGASFTKIAEKGDATPIGGQYVGVMAVGTTGTESGTLSPNQTIDIDASGRVGFLDAVTFNPGWSPPATGGVFAGAGGLATSIVTLGDELSVGTINYLYGVDLNNVGAAAYLAWSGGDLGPGGLFVNGTGRVLKGQASPGNSTYSHVCCDFRINDFDQWAVSASLADGHEGFFTGHATISDGAVLIGDPTQLGGVYNTIDSFDLNNSGDIVFNAGISVTPGRAMFVLRHGASVAVPVLVSGDGVSLRNSAIRLNNSGQMVFTDADDRVVLFSLPAEPPLSDPPHNEVLFISGIGSYDDCGANPNDAHTQTNETRWMWDYLTTTGWISLTTGLTPADFTTYDYTSGDDTFQSCNAGGTPGFTKLDSCWSLDNVYSGPDGDQYLLGQAIRLASYIHLLPSNTRVTIIAHSQGGVLATYTVHDYLTLAEDRAKVKGIVTLDSPLGGIPDGSAGLLRSHSDCANNDLRLDSAFDMLPGKPAVGLSGGSHWPATRLYTVNETGEDTLFCVPWPAMCFGGELIDDSHSQIPGWQGSHVQVTTGDHGTIWNGTGGSTYENDLEKAYIGCAAAGLSPPSSCEGFALAVAWGGNVTVNANQVTYQNLTIGGGTPSFTTLTAWPGSTVTTTLVSPSGRVINAATIASDVVHAVNATSEVFTVQSPEPGTWQVQLFGQDIPLGTEPVTLGTLVEAAVSVGGTAEQPDPDALPAQTSAASANHRTAYALVGAFVMTLAAVAAGVRAATQRQR